jgi:hypothetical protein
MGFDAVFIVVCDEFESNLLESSQWDIPISGAFCTDKS